MPFRAFHILLQLALLSCCAAQERCRNRDGKEDSSCIGEQWESQAHLLQTGKVESRVADMLAEDGQRAADSLNVSSDDATRKFHGYASRSQIPSGCKLTSKLPDGSRCLFSDQCQANFCCPYLKVCKPSAMTAEMVRADPLLKSIMWDGHCGKDVCDVCAFRNSKSAHQCVEVNGEPITQASPFKNFFPPWDDADSACKCDSRFIKAMKDGSWVPSCSGQGGGQSQCTDSASYRDPMWHVGCPVWKNYGCTGYEFTPALRAACPVACKAC